MRLVAVNTTVNSVANMTYKSGAIVSPSKIDYIDAPIMKIVYDSNIIKIGLCSLSKFLFQFNECRMTSNPVLALKM